MKAMLKKIFLIISLPVLFIAGCTDKFDEINKDPNNPVAIETGYLLTYSQKTIMDNLRDAWFAGRGTQLLCQHWSQNNYPDEDRYLIRTTTIQNAWRAFYRAAANLQQIIKMNTDEATKADARASGPNEHQIAVAMILKAYIISIITDTWGDVPYSECFNPDIRQPKYDAQADIYPQLIKELKDAAAMIDPANGDLTKGDIIYGGDVAKWKKFANTLRLRLALRMSSKDDAPLNEVKALPASSFFESNADNAKFTYLAASPNEGPVYRAFFVDNRNDFTITKPFVELLAGRNDSLNVTKINPFVGLEDPRLSIWAYQIGGKWIGMPYGMDDATTKAFAPNTCNYKNNPSVVHQPDFAYTFMDYAEFCFIMSEVNNWDQTWYEKGIRASMEDWGVDEADITAYLAAVPAANQERVLTQKYIALYMQPEQAWFEYRRTGFPKTLIKPGEITHRQGTTNIIFTPIVDGVTDIPNRMWYPVEEQGVNKPGYDAAVAAQGPDDLMTKVWWQK